MSSAHSTRSPKSNTTQLALSLPGPPLGLKERSKSALAITTLARAAQSSHLDLLPPILNVHRRPLCCLCALFAFLPRVTDADSELRPVTVERNRRHGRMVSGVLPQPLLRLVVPDRDRAVGARGGERVIAE